MGSSVFYFGDRFQFPSMFTGGVINLADESTTGSADPNAPVSNVVDGNPDKVWRRTGTTTAVLRFRNNNNLLAGEAYEPYGFILGDWMVSGLLLQNLRVYSSANGQHVAAVNIRVETATNAAFTTNLRTFERTLHYGSGFPNTIIVPLDKNANYTTSRTLSPLQWSDDMLHARVLIYAGGTNFVFELGRLGIMQALPLDIAPDYALTLSDPSVTQRAYSRRLFVRARDRFRRLKARAVGLRAEAVFGTPLNAATVTEEGLWDYEGLIPLFPNGNNLMRALTMSGVSRTVGLQLNRYPLTVATQNGQAFSVSTQSKTRAPLASQVGTFVGTLVGDPVLACSDHTDAMRPVYSIDFEIEEDNTIINTQE
jgi:hypothetical protein